MTNEEKEEKPRVIVHWNTTQFKPTIYDVETFQLMKQKPKGTAGIGGSGSTIGYPQVFNPNTNQYESPAAIDPLPPARRKRSNRSKNSLLGSNIKGECCGI